MNSDSREAQKQSKKQQLAIDKATQHPGQSADEEKDPKHSQADQFKTERVQAEGGSKSSEKELQKDRSRDNRSKQIENNQTTVNRQEIKDEISKLTTMTELGKTELDALLTKHKLLVSTLFDLGCSLNQSNFEQWRARFERKMRDKHLIELIKSKWSAETMKTPEWIDLDLRAQDNILNNVDPHFETYVQNKSTAYAMYEKLREHFEGSVILRGWRLCKLLTDLLTNARSEQLNQIAFQYQALVDKLSQLFPAIPSDFYVALYCAVLPSEYDYILSDILSQPNVTYEQVVEQTMSAYSRRKEHSENDAKLSNLAAFQTANTEPKVVQKNKKGKGAGQKGMKEKQVKPEKPKMKCTYCDYTNHLRQSCRFLAQDIISGLVKPDDAATVVRPKQANGSSRPLPPASGTQAAANETFQIAPIIMNINAAPTNHLDPNKIYLDTAAGGSATNSMRGCLSMVKSNAIVRDWAGREDTIEGVGTYKFITETGCELTFDNIAYKRTAEATFISYAKLDRTKQFRIAGENGVLQLFSKKTGALVFTARLTRENLYELDFQSGNEIRINYVRISPTVPIEFQYRYWHDLIGHVSFGYLVKCKHLLGITGNLTRRLICDICLATKGIRLSFPPSESRANELFDLVHTDLSGIVRISNPLNVNYFLVFIDDHSRYISVFLIARKYQVPECYKQYKNWISVQFNRNIKCLRSDNGTEFENLKMNSETTDLGTVKQLTAHGNPQQNGRSERVMRTIDEMARALLKAAGLSIRFWPYAVMYAVYLKNRLPHAGIDFEIPYVVMFGKQPVFKDIIKFGAIVFVIDLSYKTKFKDRERPAIFLGYPDNVKGYLVYLIDEHRTDTVAQITLSEDAYGSEVKMSSAYQPDKTDTEIYGIDEEEILRKQLFVFEENESSADEVLEQMEPLVVDDEESNEIQFEPAQFDQLRDEFHTSAGQGELNVPAVQGLVTSSDTGLTISSEETAEHQANESSSDLSNRGVDPPGHAEQTEPQNSGLPDPNLQNSATTDPAGEPPRLLTEILDVNHTNHTVQPTGRIIMNAKQRIWFKSVFPDAQFTSHVPYRKKLPDKSQGSIVNVNAIQVPRSFKEATTGTYKHIFCPAMDKEMASQIKNKAWKVVPKPPNTPILPTFWVYTLKTDNHGLITGGKARLVILGNKQMVEIGENNYAAVVHHTTLRTIESIAVRNGWYLEHIDVDTAFLYGEVNGKIYVRQAPGYEVPGDGTQLVYELDKSVYGLRQSARQWFRKLTGVLIGLKFRQLLTDRCVFIRRTGDAILIVVVFVDDGMLTSNSPNELKMFKSEFKRYFSFKDHTQVKSFLNVRMQYDRINRVLQMDQSHYIYHILREAGFVKCLQIMRR